MGSFEPEGVAVTKAVPICHEVPTKPLVENALALVTSVAAEEVVGWYTVPERFEETKPSPAALRIVANLAVGSKSEPILIVLNNVGLTSLLAGKEPADDETLLQAFGKDFGQQWMDPIPKILMDNKAKGAAKQAFEQKVAVTDFVDHLEADASSSWLENAALDKLVVQ